MNRPPRQRDNLRGPQDLFLLCIRIVWIVLVRLVQSFVVRRQERFSSMKVILVQMELCIFLEVFCSQMGSCSALLSTL